MTIDAAVPVVITNGANPNRGSGATLGLPQTAHPPAVVSLSTSPVVRFIAANRSTVHCAMSSWASLPRDPVPSAARAVRGPRLALGLLVVAEHHRPSRGAHVEAADIDQLLLEQRIVAALEGVTFHGFRIADSHPGCSCRVSVSTLVTVPAGSED